MQLNSNDLFSQIGLVVSNQESSNDNPYYYTVYLEIELSQGKNELLQIRNYDNPHEVAIRFCKKHRLNQLAVQIVENKIIEAKDKEEKRLKESIHDKSKESLQSFNKSSVSSRYRNIKKLNESLSRNKYVSKQSRKKSLGSSIHSRSKSNKKNQTNKTVEVKSKSKQNKNVNKKIKQRNEKIISQKKKKSTSINNKSMINASPKKEKPKKANPNIGNQLYARAIMRNRNLENERAKRRQQQMRKENEQLTFQPKINTVSTKIVQFRKQFGDEPERDKQKQNQRLAQNQQKTTEEANQIKECTFKPQINRVSELISQNRNVYNNQFDHFTALYKQAGAKKERINAKIDQSSQQLFQPKINPKSYEVVKETFQQRLEKSIIRKKVIKEGNPQDDELSFKPKIGRAPKNASKFNRSSDSTYSWWDHLHYQKLKTSQVPTPQEVQQKSNPTINSNSNIYFENLVEKRVAQVFKALDSDEDGIISPDCIAIQRLTKNQLIFLKPLFEEMDELYAYLDLIEFRKALNMLLAQADVHKRGQFLTERPKKQERSSFAPEINKKSKQLAMTRIASGVQVFEQLYENGLKDLQRKEYQNQKIREQQQELEMEECSFKPLLNNTSKYYIDKVLGKKMSRFDDDDQEN